MAKYSVGDSVVVRDDVFIGGFYRMEDGEQEGVYWQAGMEDYKGKTVTIATVGVNIGGNGVLYEIKEDNMHYFWSDELFDDLTNNMKR